MKITSIELTGYFEHGKRTPRASARISRTANDEYIEIRIIRPNCGDWKSTVQADCAEDIRSAASCLHHALEGRNGNNREIEEYVRAIRRVAN